MATKKPTKKSSKPQPKVVVSKNGSRLRNLSRRENKKKSKIEQRSKKVISSWQILKLSLRHLYQNKKLFLGILAIYGVLYILFVKGISSNFQIGSLRENLKETFGGKLGTFSTGLALYGLLLGSAGSGSGDISGTYQTILVVITSLALIWALRQTYSGAKKLRIRDSFYKGMYALVPFIIVMLAIVVQLLPALIVSSLYSVLQNNSLIVGTPEQVVATIVLIAGLMLSLFWISSSLFAVYIVTLPNTDPRDALRAAKKLIRFRRAVIIRRVLFLPLVLLIISAAILIPLIILLAPAAEVLFVLFTILVIAVVHSYFYTLYRSLLNE